MRVLVCGSRTFRDCHPIWLLLDGMALSASNHLSTLTVIAGGAEGADRIAAEYAQQSQHSWEKGLVVHETFSADWVKHGKAAGPIRNQRMLDEGKPEAVYAFVDKPLVESRGTNDMVKRATAAGLPVYVVRAGD